MGFSVSRYYQKIVTRSFNSTEQTFYKQQLQVEGRTGEAIPEQRPENFRVQDVGSRSATFYWDPVDESQIQANFTGYKLTYWYDDEDLNEVSEDPEEGTTMRMVRRQLDELIRSKRQIHEAGRQKSIIVAPGMNRVTIHGLKPNAQNYAVVQVVTSQHEGPKSEVLTFRTREGKYYSIHGSAKNFVDIFVN